MQDTSVTASTASGRSRITWLLVLVAAFHIPTLFNAFFIDDYVYLETVQNLDWDRVVDIFTTSTMGEEASGVWWTPTGVLPFYRPLGEMTFAADFLVWGLRPFGYHLTNLMLHLLCTFLAWRLGGRLFDSPVARLALPTIFALHPVHNEALAWISGRFDLLVCVCALACVLSYLNWQEDRPRRRLWGAFSVLWFVAGLGCKETALVLPAVLVGLELVRWRGHDAGYRSRRLVVGAAAFGLVALAYLGCRFALFGGLGTLPPPYGVDLSSPLRAAGMIAWHFALYLMDFAIFIQVDAIYLADFWSKHGFVMVLALTVSLLLFVACALLAWRSRGFRLGLMWLGLFTAPSLLAMPGERNVYLASVGVALMAAAALEALMRRGRQAAWIHRWVQRGSRAVLCLWCVLGGVEYGIMWCVAGSGEKVFRDLEALLPDPPQDARIYVVNQCPLNAVGFDQAVRLRYGRADLSGCALSLSPTLEATSSDRIVRTGPASIRVVREGGVFFQSFVERFHLFSQPASALPEAGRRFDLELLNPPSSYDRLTELEFRLPHPIEDPRTQIFVWNNEHIRSRSDFVGMMRLTHLTRYQPGQSAHAAAISAVAR